MKKIEKNYKSTCFFDEEMVELGSKFTLTILNSFKENIKWLKK